MATLCVLVANPANAVRPDECEQQRAAFPKEWNDVSKENRFSFARLTIQAPSKSRSERATKTVVA